MEDVVLMGRTPYKGIAEGDNAEDIAIAERSMEETGVVDMGSLSFIQLSGGEQQRVMLARALSQETSCLILDEPTNHLDITYQLQIMDLITSRNMTVIAAIHDLNIAAMYCDHIVALQMENNSARNSTGSSYKREHKGSLPCECGNSYESGRPSCYYL